MSKSRALLGLIVIAACLMLAPAPTNAQTLENGPTPGDFIGPDGVFDQAGYIAALIAFQTAPLVAPGPLVLTIHQCKPGDLVSAELLGRPETLVSATVPASAVATLTIVIPDDTELGFNRIRVSCTSQVAAQSMSVTLMGAASSSEVMAAATPYLVKDIVINVVAPGTPGAVSSLEVFMIAEPTPAEPGNLPSTGTEVRELVGVGLALLLVGAAVGMGVRQRLHSPAP